MRIAYVNLLDTALDLTATNVDNDSSVNNLFHPYLEHALYCTQTGTVISGRWVDPQTISCTAVAYHTAETCVLRLYGVSGTLLHTETITLETADSVYYFTAAIADVYSFTMTFTSGEQIRIGYVYVGRCYELSGHNVQPVFGNDFTSKKSQTAYGQTYGTFGRRLRGFKCTFPALTVAERDTILTYLDTVQTVKPHMIDVYPESHEVEPSMYCTVDKKAIDATKGANGIYFSLSIEWTEAR